MPSDRLRGPCSPSADRRKRKQDPDLRPRALSGTRTRGVNEPLLRAIVGAHAAGGPGRRRASACASTGGCARASATPAGGRASRPSRCASARSSPRTPRGPTSRRPSSVLRRRGLLSFEALAASPRRGSRRSSAPRGTFRVKARRLRAFLDFLGAEYGGRVEGMARGEPCGACARSSSRCRASAPRPPTRSPSTPPGTRSSSSTPTPAASSPGWGSCGGDETYDEVQRFFMRTASPATPASTTTTTPRSCASARTTAARARAAPRCPLDGPLSSRGIVLPRDSGMLGPEGMSLSPRRSSAWKAPMKAPMKPIPVRPSAPSPPLAVPAPAQDFWAHWGDGKAELNGYAPEAAALRRAPDGHRRAHLRDRGLLRLAPRQGGSREAPRRRTSTR